MSRDNARGGKFFSPFSLAPKKNSGLRLQTHAPHSSAVRFVTFHLSPRLAFTLAEVLITLGVIGIVAAMTIPPLVENNQKTQYVTGLKKFYSSFSLVLQQYAAEEGTPGDLSRTSVFTDNSVCYDDGEGGQICSPNGTFTWGVLGKYFIQIKNCENSWKQCWSDNYQNSVDYSNGYIAFVIPTGTPNALLGDGMSVKLKTYGICNPSDTNTRPDLCGEVSVDVNGLKPPNIPGRDAFVFYIRKDGMLIPFGSYLKNQNGYYYSYRQWNGGSNYSCRNFVTAKEHEECSGRIVDEGWQMTY